MGVSIHDAYLLVLGAIGGFRGGDSPQIG